jgi:endo-1,4-beta-D-glucanase Y
MLISVLKRNQADFDGLCRYFFRFRNRYGLMQWQQQQKHPQAPFVPGGEGGENCATDGDVDIATALFLAAKVWGRGGQHGEIDYRATALELCGAIWEKCINHRTFMPLVGDWVDDGDDAYKLTRPSDFILSAYLLFSRVRMCYNFKSVVPPYLTFLIINLPSIIGGYPQSTTMAKCLQCYHQ